MWWWHNGWWWGGMWSFGFLVVIGIFAFLVWMIRQSRPEAGRGPGGPGGPAATGRDEAMEILRQRYARGEIDKDEFERKKADLAR